MMGEMDGDGIAISWYGAPATHMVLADVVDWVFARCRRHETVGRGGRPADACRHRRRWKMDLIVWRPSTGTFYWLTSSTGYAFASAGTKQWGAQGRHPEGR